MNPLLNAVAEGPFVKEALDEAAKIDERFDRGLISELELKRKPFLGVPFTVKESTAVGGKLHTLGLLCRSNVRVDEDAECVRLMKAAGGICIATSNIPELNRFFESSNNLIGRTSNPYDNRRTCGGSSGGEGALISSCGSCIGLGTDFGGSVRIPAFFCGIFGHKPTACAINTRGCIYRTGDDTETMVVVGPISRYATDLLPMMRVLVDPRYESRMQLDRKVDVKGLRFYYCVDTGNVQEPTISRDMFQSLMKVKDHFEKITGNECKQVSFESMKSAELIYTYWTQREPSDYRKYLGKEYNADKELLKFLFGKRELTLAMIGNLKKKPIADSPEIEKLTNKLRDELETLLGDDGVLIFPSSTTVAGYHGSAYVDLYRFYYFAIFNVARVPVTQVPLGLNKEGLPLGVQVVSTAFRDINCLAVAAELERAFGGWQPPFEIKHGDVANTGSAIGPSRRWRGDNGTPRRQH